MSDFTAHEAALDRNSVRGNSETPHAPIDSHVNRRAFLAGMGLGSAVFALSPHLRSVFESDAEELLLSVGSFGAGDAGTLHLLHIHRGKTGVLNSHPSARPAAIVRHPFRSLIYVANHVNLHQHQPRGTIETFAFDQSAGMLELVGRQPLSLSATQPRSLAVSPDGRNLLVAAFGGGAYNVLPIDDAGLPAAPTVILKQVGSGPNPTEQASAHPSHVLFHSGKGIAIAADYGADRLNILTCNRGESVDGSMKVADRISCTAGSGPSKIAMRSDGELLVVTHTLRPAITAFRLTPEMKLVRVGYAPLNEAPTAICFSSQENIVFLAHKHGAQQASLAAWRVDPQRGTLWKISEMAIPAGEVASMQPGGPTLWLASDRGMVAVELDAQTVTPRATYRVSSTPNLRSMVLL